MQTLICFHTSYMENINFHNTLPWLHVPFKCPILRKLIYAPHRISWKHRIMHYLYLHIYMLYYCVFACFIMAPEGEPYSNQYVCPFVRSSVRHRLLFSDGSSLCSLLLQSIPIYRGNNVDLQHILNFDLHPSMTAGQGHKILQFCEFMLLP